MRGDAITTIIVGGAAGAATAFGFWALFRFAIDRQVTQTIDREVPPRVRAELDNKLRSIGITPQVGAAIANLTGQLDQAGIWTAIAQAGR